MSFVERWKEYQWLSRLNRGEAAAFTEIFDEYAPRLFRHARLRVARREVAEDLASQAFLKAWEHIVSGGPAIRSVKPFLFRILDNLIVDYYRAREREELLSLDEAAFALEDPRFGAGEVVLGLERDYTRVLIEGALQAIAPQYRQMLVWRYIDEFSVGAIVKLSGKSRNAVYVTLYRALKAMKKILEVRS